MRRKIKLPKAPAIQYHYTSQYLLTPQHPITVKVIGCGGSGSQMLQALARIHVSLVGLGHPGLSVQAWDPDKVTEANLGRQLFSTSDLGQYKAKILVQRINRFYGIAWNAMPILYDQSMIDQRSSANILITCVDNTKARIMIAEQMTKLVNKGDERNPFSLALYWLDLGNTRTTGQVVLGTFAKVKQPKGTRNCVGKLPHILDLVPDLKRHEEADQAPSCSLAEALGKQDLFINSTLVQYGADLIWKLFRELRIQYHGVYVNLETLTTNPITVKK